MRAALILLGWGISLHLLNAYYAGELSGSQSAVNDLAVKNAALAEDNARLALQLDAAITIAKRFQRSQCGT